MLASSSVQPNITTAKSRLPLPTSNADSPVEYDQDAEAKLKGPKLLIPKGNVWIALVLTALSFFTRLYQIDKAAFVVWDEAHFGKFASHYLKRTFYHDVHPPLGKMLNGLAGYLAGYDGSFKFESGAAYPGKYYIFMRIFNATFGALMVPLAYYTAVHLRLSHSACILFAVFILTDLALCNISRFILLDSMLLFFTCLSTYCLCVFYNYQRTAPFSRLWFKWMILTGMSIGAVTSVKWVGFFAIALVGLHTVQELWEMLSDEKISMKSYAGHWLARIVALIIVPISIYILCFSIHFKILNRSGEGDATMSSLFQANLEGIDFSSNPLEIAIGSKVTIKNYARAGALLHSHVQKFPDGSGQQQVTAYPHKDDNNDWIVTKPWGFPSYDPQSPIEFVKNGDVIRLVHSSTGRNLHSHKVPAPLTKEHYEVSCYGDSTIGDANDHWKVEIDYDFAMKKPSDTVRSLTTRFRLVHNVTKCLLGSHSKTLPPWGFAQNEVYCDKSGDKKARNNMWNIEKHVNERLPAAGPLAFKSDFLTDFVDLNVAMWSSNQALTPDMDKQDDLVSSPYQWPLLLVGLRMCGWGDYEIKYFLLGNPLVWWGSSLSILVLSLVVLVYAIRFRRGNLDFVSQDASNTFYFSAKIGLLGWILHYIPFWIMGRVTYLHHYFPAVYFASIAMTVLLDHFTNKLHPKSKTIVIASVGLFSILLFIYFKDFVLGMSIPSKEYSNRRWVSSWTVYDTGEI